MSRVILKYLIPLNVLLVHMLWGISTILVIQTSQLTDGLEKALFRSFRQT